MEDQKTEKEEEKKNNIKKKIPKWWEKIFNPKRINKQKKVAVIFLRENNTSEPMELLSKDGMFSIRGKVYHEKRDCIYRLVLKDETVPLAIIPEWSMVPIGTMAEEDQPLKKKFAELQDLVLKGVRHAELVKLGGGGLEKSVSTKQVILYVILAIIGGAVISSFL